MMAARRDKVALSGGRQGMSDAEATTQGCPCAVYWKGNQGRREACPYTVCCMGNRAGARHAPTLFAVWGTGQARGLPLRRFS